MKNKESFKRPLSSKNGSIKGNNKNKIEIEQTNKKNLDKESLLNINSSKQKMNKGPTKSQINRLKNFYNTTRWLPNSAFTTYFGKPAFENYGYGNTKPVYGGLFYGNYMLTHNINPIDGENRPESKQVYSSAMLKTIKNNHTRIPEPPRKVPDEIRNTHDELEEIKARKPIFQQDNIFPERYIVKPNLVKARVFRSGKNSPQKSDNDECGVKELYDGTFNIEDVLNGRQTKRKSKGKSIENTTFENVNFNPFGPSAPKKKLKEKLNNSNSKSNLNHTRDNKSANNINKSQEDISHDMDGNFIEDEYRKQVEFYEKMLKDNINIENESYVGEQKYSPPNNQRDEYNKNSFEKNQVINNEHNNDQTQNEKCSLCEHSNNDSRRLRKKENPCLIEPQDINHTHICCTHQPNRKLNMEDLDPRNYKYMPICTMEKIIPAGKPTKHSDPISSIFQ